MTSTSEQTKTSPNRSIFYLVYLVFLFLPWLFYPPNAVDIAVALAATLAYLPLHFGCSVAEGSRKLWFIAAIATIALVIAPFNNGHSVFHIYAAASAGYVRPIKASSIALGLCIAVYAASALFFDRYILEIAVGLVISIVVWVSTFSDAETSANHERAERERTLESQQASLVERERIARDLHDLLGHTLTLVALKADLANRLIDNDPERAKLEIENIQSSTREALSDVRATLSGLTFTSVKHELENGKAAFAAAGIRLDISGALPELSQQRDTAIGLMIREAVTNIIRHSSATKVEVTFESEDDMFHVTVSDNGAANGIHEGNGLAGLRGRLEALGGALSVANRGGIQLRAMLPI